MIENKKTDYNSLIGFGLMALLLMGYFYMTKPSDVELEKVKIEQELKEKKVVNQQNKLQSDSLVSINATTNGVGELKILQNDLFEFKINTKGGVLAEAKLNKYKVYAPKEEEKEELFLIKNNNSVFNVALKSSEGVVYTQNLIFTPSITKDDKGTQLVLKNQQNGKVVQFIYTVTPNEYMVNFHIQTNGYQLTEAVVDWKLKAFTHEKGKTWEQTQSEIYYTFDNYNDDDYFTSSDGEEVDVNWIAYRQQFFTSILLTDIPFKSAKVTIENNKNDGFTKNYSSEINLALSGTELNNKMQWYLGPVDYDVLDSYDKNLTVINDFGWGIFGFLNKYFFLKIFKLLEKTGLQYGIIILLMTIVVKLILSPVTYKQYLVSAKTKIIKPEMDEINAKYPGQENALKRQQEIMALQSKAGASPLAGCLPALLQIPIFYALFNFFPSVINLRQKAFLWADDLTAYDSILDLGFNIPVYGDHISLFTILYALIMFLYMRISGQGNMQAPQQEGMPNMKYIMYLMPLMFVVWLNNYASGLSYYYFLSNLINIGLILVIKNYILDEKKIHAQIEAKKAKPKKKSKWGAKMQDIMKQAEEEKRRRERK